MTRDEMFANPQKLIDEWLEGNPEVLEEYADWIRYVPDNKVPSEDFTDVLRLITRKGESLTVAAKVKEPYKSLVDVIASLY